MTVSSRSRSSPGVDEPRYGKERWEAAQASWAAGAPWDPEWLEWRPLAAEHGIPEPPHGGRWDSWDDDHPSQLALVTRAIRESPGWLRAAILDPRNRSWGDVVGAVLRRRDAQGEARAEERGSAADPDPAEARRIWARLQADVGRQQALHPDKGAP